MTFDHPVTLVGGGQVEASMLTEARAIAPQVLAADGGAGHLHRFGLSPMAIVGDMDSVGDQGIWHRRGVQTHHMADQDSTDFQKCLRVIRAPLIVGVGFLGHRQDHGLAALSALTRYPAPVVLLGEREAVTHCPTGQRVDVPMTPGAVVSIFPMDEVTGTVSRGLAWSVDELTLTPRGQIGTSNRATGDVSVRFDRDGALLFVERCYLRALCDARLSV